MTDGTCPPPAGARVPAADGHRYPAATSTEGSTMKHAPRLASPIGFGLALLLFLLLPFVAVSCEVPGLGSAELSCSGADLVGNADPSVSTEGGFDSGGEAAPITDNENPPTPGGGGQALAIITLVLLVGGLGVSLIPLARTRL